jgi:hypothetical protein
LSSRIRTASGASTRLARPAPAPTPPEGTRGVPRPWSPTIFLIPLLDRSPYPGKHYAVAAAAASTGPGSTPALIHGEQRLLLRVELPDDLDRLGPAMEAAECTVL